MYNPVQSKFDVHLASEATQQHTCPFGLLDECGARFPYLLPWGPHPGALASYRNNKLRGLLHVGTTVMHSMRTNGPSICTSNLDASLKTISGSSKSTFAANLITL